MVLAPCHKRDRDGKGKEKGEGCVREGYGNMQLASGDSQSNDSIRTRQARQFQHQLYHQRNRAVIHYRLALGLQRMKSTS